MLNVIRQKIWLKLHTKSLRLGHLMAEIGNPVVDEKFANLFSRIQSFGCEFRTYAHPDELNGDMGRYTRIGSRRIILIARPSPLNSISEVLDTIIHESIHMTGEGDYLARHVLAPIDREDPVYFVEEFITMSATMKIGSMIGIDTLPSPAEFNSKNYPGYQNRMRGRFTDLGLRRVDEFIDAAVDHMLTGQMRRLGSVKSLVDLHSRR